MDKELHPFNWDGCVYRITLYRSDSRPGYTVEIHQYRKDGDWWIWMGYGLFCSAGLVDWYWSTTFIQAINIKHNKNVNPNSPLIKEFKEQVEKLIIGHLKDHGIYL